MDRRIPSTSSAVGRSFRSTIRHRSGAYDSGKDQEGDSRLKVERSGSPSQHSERTDHTLTVQVEDTDDAEHTPTILLVRRSRVSARSSRSRYKPLPGLPFGNHDSDRHTATLSSLHGGEHADSRTQMANTPTLHEADLHGSAFSPVPLTPRPPQPERGQSELTVRSGDVGSACSSRLPTPDYPAPEGASASRGLTSYFPRMPSLRVSRPAPPRTESEGSTYSCVSSGSTVLSTGGKPKLDGGLWPRSSTVGMPGDAARVPTAIKDKRPLLLSTFSTTDKFTQKFPRPRSIKGLSLDGPATVMDQGEGLGLERVERWTIHKWWLIFSVCTVLIYGTAGLVCALLTWFRAWQHADLMYVTDYDILVLLTLAASILILTALVGLAGTLLNSRPLLAVYAVLLWPGLLALLAIGYPAYKRYAFALDRKLSRAWSEYYTPLGRRVLQDALSCCGFLTPAHAAAPSARCYPRSPLPGCKAALWRAQRAALATVWSAVFALVPVHIANIVVALLCANHVTRAWGEGITPKRYRLNADDVRADKEMLLRVLGERLAVARPRYARAPTSGAFREDKTICAGGDGVWETGTVNLGICR